MDGHDAVVHFAAESHVDRSIVDPDAFVSTNCVGTNVLCDVGPPRRGRALPAHLHRRGVRLDRGGLVHARPTRSARARRTRRPRPAATSSRSSYRETYGLPVIVTRSSNNFGPYQFPEKVIPLFVTNLLDGKQGAALRRRLQRPRLVLRRGQLRGVDLVLRTRQRRRDLQHRRRQRDHRTASSPTASSACLGARRGDDRVRRPTASGHDRRYSIATDKVEALGWRPSRDFDEALRPPSSWYRDNRWWWEPLKRGA